MADERDIIVVQPWIVALAGVFLVAGTVFAACLPLAGLPNTTAWRVTIGLVLAASPLPFYYKLDETKHWPWYIITAYALGLDIALLVPAIVSG